MTTTFYGDVETFSEVPIRHGAYKYAENCELLLFSWALNDGIVDVVDFTDAHDTSEMEYALKWADEVVFHNSMFDRAVLSARAPHLCAPLPKWRDTMARALAHSLPGGLEKLCVILDAPVDKRKMIVGKDLIRLFCKPLPKNHRMRRATRHTHPQDWKTFIDYAGVDVDGMRYIWGKLPRWNYVGHELDLWHLDQQVNDLGVLVDMEMVDAALRTVDREQARLARHTVELTDGQVGRTTQRDKLLVHLLMEHGVLLPDMQTSTLERRIEDPDLPWQVRALLLNRMEASAASLAKYKALKRSACADGRVRGTLQFCGAQRTGRWAGRVIQPQNFKRTPKYLAGDQVPITRQAVKDEVVDLVYHKPMEVLSSSVPWALIPAPGKKFCISDLRNVEGRVLAWLANEEWKLDAYRHYDEAPKDLTRDLYIVGYSKSFGEEIADVIEDYLAGGQKRQIGKVQDLALGYQGAVGAFVSMAAVYGVDLNILAPIVDRLSPAEYAAALDNWNYAESQGLTFDLSREVYMVCHAFTHAWRGTHPNVVLLWAALQEAARDAVRNPGRIYNVGRLSFERKKHWLRMTLPSGGHLCYPHPKAGVKSGKVSYMGVDQYTRRWKRIDSYGGKLAENATQAIATGSRGLLGWAMKPAAEAGYCPVFTAHDELVTETPDTEEFSSDELGRILATPPHWADGLPLAADGYESKFYRKD